MKFLSCEKISEHKYKTPEGYLICIDSILARTGKQTYKRREVFGVDCTDAENEIDVDRTPEEVFSDKTLASFENKPLTMEHPDEDVNIENHNTLSVGFARDIKRGKTDKGEDVMLGTLVFTDADAIEAIENGEMTDLSCGYDCDIVDEENPCQRNIRGNHIALCQQGRAGIARIVDSIEKTMPSIKALGKWQWDDVIQDWYDDGRHMYYNEVIRKSGGKDSINDGYLSEEEKELVDYVIENLDHHGNADEAIRLMNSYYSMYQRLARHKPNEVKEYFNQHVDDSTKDAGHSAEQMAKNEIRKLEQEIRDKEYELEALQKEDYRYGSAKSTDRKQAAIKAQLNTLRGRLNRLKHDWSYCLDSLREPTSSELKKFEDYLIQRHWHVKKLGVTWTGRIHYEVSKLLQAGDNDKLIINEIDAAENYSGLDLTYSVGSTGKELKGVVDINKVYIKDSIVDGLVKTTNPEIHAWKERGKYRTQAYNRRNLDYASLQDIARKYNVIIKESSYDYVDIISDDKSKIYKAFSEINPAISVGSWSIVDSDTYEEVTKNLKEQAKKEMKDVEKDPSLIFYSNSLLKKIMKTSSNPKEREIAKNELLARGVKLDDTYLDSKDDLISKLRSTRIKEDETFEMRDGQYLIQIQNVGKQELSTRSGPLKFNGSNQSMRIATKVSSHAWGRIWKNGTLVFNESDALNIIRDKMINFLKTVRDSLKQFKVKYKDSKGRQVIQFVKAKSLADAIKQIKDDRLAPMTYKKLKELGVSKETYSKWTQEQANKYIAAKSKVEKANSKAEEKESHSKLTEEEKLSIRKKLFATAELEEFLEYDRIFPSHKKAGVVAYTINTKDKTKAEQMQKKLSSVDLDSTLELVEHPAGNFYRIKTNVQADGSVKKHSASSNKTQSSNNLAGSFSMQINEAYDEYELDEAEYAINSAYEDGDLIEEHYKSLLEELDSKREELE